LYHEVFDSLEQTDTYIQHFIQNLLSTSPLALQSLKKILWQGTHHWDELLDERAGISGRLVITDAAQQAIKKARLA
jgi:methylglutaconyl-CoA hydratase